MTGIMQFETAHCVISIEVDEAVARAAGGEGHGELTSKGSGGEAGDIVAPAIAGIDKTLATLKAYVGTLADMVETLGITPEQVSVELGLKFTGSAGFVIAKAGAETHMKVSLSWKPASNDRDGRADGNATRVPSSDRSAA